MTDSFETKLDRLAELMVHAGAVEEGTHVLLPYHTGAEALVRRVSRHAYLMGATHVNYLIEEDHEMLHQQLSLAPPDWRTYFPASYRAAWDELMDAPKSSVIQLRVDRDPELFGGELSEVFGQWESRMWQARGRFRTEGIDQGKVPWTLTYVPTTHSAEAAFPELKGQRAVRAYWKAIFEMTGTNKQGALKRWRDGQAKLRARRDKLNDLHIKELCFSSPETNLLVGLSSLSDWVIAAKESKDGRLFTANLPSFEVFTTPDWRTVEGQVLVTMPVVIGGEVVRGLRLTFRLGRVVDVSADSGEAAVRRLLDMDEAVAQLGEVALVGLDSPVARQGRLFQNGLFDENAACHIALGTAYAYGIKGGTTMSREELDALGCNHCKEREVHEDVMISDGHTSVVAHTRDGRKILLIENGHWTSDFR